MANRQHGFGFSAEVKNKINSKYDPALEQEAMEWIVYWLPELSAEKPQGQKNVHQWLKNGRVLCQLINKISPGSVRKINKNNMAFMQMENIGNFLKAAENFGMNKNDAFQTVDLFEGTNMPQVISGLHALGRVCKKKGLVGIGPKEADSNVRTFSEQQLQAGKNIIGLQMGTNKGASQAGQNFGKTRAIID